MEFKWKRVGDGEGDQICLELQRGQVNKNKNRKKKTNY